MAYRSHENGIRGLRPTVAKKYAKGFRVSFSWLMTGEGDMFGPGIDAELVALPPEMSKRLINAFREMIATVKLRGKI